MKKLILILTILAAFLIAGCSGPGYTGDKCYDNDVCSVKEQYLGNCDDCIPDFEVQEENSNAYLYGNVIDANVCVKNLHGEYTGDVILSWVLLNMNGGVATASEETVYFDSQEIQANLNINVGPGTIDGWSNLHIGDQEEWACFYKQFNVGISDEFTVKFEINVDKAVEEQNYNNNFIEMNLKGNLDPSQYLILKDIFDWGYDDWRFNIFDFEMNNNAYEFDAYIAEYSVTSGQDGIALVGVNFDEGTPFDFMMDLIEEEFDGVYATFDMGGNIIYYIPNISDGFAMWVSNDKFVYTVTEGSSWENEITAAYYEKHPSTIIA